MIPENLELPQILLYSAAPDEVSASRQSLDTQHGPLDYLAVCLAGNRQHIRTG